MLVRVRAAFVHPDKLDMVRALGADHVVDYTREYFTRGTKRYDLIFDVASNPSLSDCRRVLTPAGSYVLIGHDHYGKAHGLILGSLPRALGLMARSPFVRQLPIPDISNPRQSELMAALKRSSKPGSSRRLWIGRSRWARSGTACATS